MDVSRRTMVPGTKRGESVREALCAAVSTFWLSPEAKYTCATAFSITRGLWLVVPILFFLCNTAAAQDTGQVQGCVERGEAEPVSGVNVVLVGTLHGAVTGEDGCFRMEGVRPGTYRLRVSPLDYEEQEREVDVEAGETVDVHVRLRVEALDLQDVEVRARRLDPMPVVERTQGAFRERSYQAVEEGLRNMPGADAGRSGSLAFTPAVRGLSGGQVAFLVNDVPILPGAPLGFDSALSHFDPFNVARIRVVKGPYALARGGGLSTILVEGHTPTTDVPIRLSSVQAGAVQNRGGLELAARIEGAPGRLRYVLDVVGRHAGNYSEGDGLAVSARMLGASAHGQAFFDLDPSNRITLSGHFQRTSDVDAAALRNLVGRQGASGGKLRYQGAFAGPIQYLDAHVYLQGADHTLHLRDVDEERHQLQSRLRHVGGRVTVEPVSVAGIEWLVGFDASALLEDALFEGMVPCPPGNVCLTPELSVEYYLWPDVLTHQVGPFVQGRRDAFGFDITAAARLDYSRATARAETVHEQLEARHTSLSAAFAISRPLSAAWTASLGAGSATRAPSTDERFLLHEQAPRSNVIALGNPALAPERNTQLDLWLLGELGPLNVRAGLFARRIGNYITAMSVRSAPPDPTYRMANASAVHYGGEARAELASRLGTTLAGTVAYTWGEDTSATEAVFGLPPLTGQLEARLQPFGERLFLAGDLMLAAAQSRVASHLREPTSSGYVIGNVRFGMPLSGSVAVIAGIENILNRAYARHVNVSFQHSGIHVPAAGEPAPLVGRLPEPGRTFFLRLRVTP